MGEIQSDKKNFEKSVIHWGTDHYGNPFLNSFVYSYDLLFQVARYNRTEIAFQYVEGLLKLEKGKANMERMIEEIPKSEYRAWIVNERLFLPESWVKDKIRCKLAGIPKEEIRYKTKPELALEMIDEMVKGDGRQKSHSQT